MEIFDTMDEDIYKWHNRNGILDGIKQVIIDDEMLKLLQISKKELDELLSESFVEGVDYIDLKGMTDEEIKKAKFKKPKNKPR